jgi:probable F420-dependent oxidoreductase
MVFSGVCVQGPTVGRHVEVAREAERLGYETAWVTEVQGPDAVTVMAAIAAATERLTICTGIVPVYVRDPFLMAMTFHSLQDLSGGRMVAGFGTSTPAIVTGWHGIPFERPIAKTRAYVDIVRKLLAGERVKAEGEFTIRGASLRNAVKTPVPIYLAALNDRMLELAGEVADGVILNFPTIGYVEWAIAAISRGLAKAGRERSSIDIVANFRTGPGSFDAFGPSLRRELLSYFTAPVYQKVWRADGYAAEVETVSGLWASGDRAGALSAIPDAFVDAHGIIGTPAECRAKVQRFFDAGVDHAVLFPLAGERDRTADQYLETMAAFGRG